MKGRRNVSKPARATPLEPHRATVALALALVVLAVAASTAQAITLPNGWSHAQVNVMIKHKPHTLIYDRGTVTRVAAKSLTLKERDGSVVLIRISPAAEITLEGAPSTLTKLYPGVFAMTVRVDGAPAKQVRANRVPPLG